MNCFKNIFRAKQEKSAVSVKVTRFPYEISRRLNELAQPKIYLYPDWTPRCPRTKYDVAKCALRTVKISDRLIELSKPKKSLLQRYKKAALTKYGVSKRALRYKLSERLVSLARAKHVPEKPTVDGKTEHGVVPWALSSGNDANDRIKYLATPKQYIPIDLPLSRVSERALEYIASNRIIELAEPKTYETARDRPRTVYGVRMSALREFELPGRILELSKSKAPNAGEGDEIEYTGFGIAKTALTYKASERVRLLATPRSIVVKKKAQIPITNVDLSKFGISLRALKAEASDRVIQLATARQYESDGPSEPRTKFGVAEKALMYTATKRMLDLARPRTATQKIKNDDV